MQRNQVIQARLLTLLREHGWRRVELEPFVPQNVRAGTWALVSDWVPQGLQAYLHFRELSYRGMGLVVDVRDRLPDHYFMYEDVGQQWATVPWRRPWREQLARIVRGLDQVRLARLGQSAQPSPVSPGEAHWLNSTEPLSMFQHITGRNHERKLRLFACAGIRRLQHVMDDERNVLAVEAMHQYADEQVPRRDMKKARKAARMPWLSAFEPTEEALQVVRTTEVTSTQEQYRSLCGLLREVFGNPYRSCKIRNSWLRWNNQAVTRIARTIYEERRFEELPILGDALEEAGCTEEALLSHCRDIGEHVPGCWVLDLLLGKK